MGIWSELEIRWKLEIHSKLGIRGWERYDQDWEYDQILEYNPMISQNLGIWLDWEYSEFLGSWEENTPPAYPMGSVYPPGTLGGISSHDP